ncbi:MFS transporter [Haliovirga abyssi]|uniref:MFS transporter n=1 Tax=Haliovirga abyssi TaxID=2996794 RepID=A0AAU9DGF7_9FUSO|nr:MFS transporter [Haliovirga abyssi]BDU49769.1 MFS transporter [Haliovirga abyssi]
MGRRFYLYILGRLVSIIGTGVQMLALPLYVLDISKSAAVMGGFVAVTTLPSIIFLPFFGVIADKKNKKNIMVLSDILSGITTLFMFLTIFFNFNSIYILGFLQMILLLINSFFYSSTMAFFGEIVQEKDLQKASSISETNNNIAKLGAPFLGGIIYMAYGIKLIFLINSISFFISALLEKFIKYEFKKVENNNKLKLKNFIEDIKETLIYINSYLDLKEVVILAIFLNLFVMPLFSVVLPYGLRVVLKVNSSEYGIIETIFALGTIVGSLVYGMLNNKVKFKKYYLLGAFFIILFIYGISFNIGIKNVFMLSSIFFMIFSLMITIINLPLMVEFQKLVDNKIKARFFSIFMFLSQILVPLTSYLFGLMVSKINIYLFIYFISISSIIFLLIMKKRYEFIRKIEMLKINKEY